MRFTGSVDVDRPLQEVVDLFADLDNRIHYQDGFESWELVSGTAGEDGAVYKLHYNNRGRPMELTETVVANRLPDSYEAFYEHSHMDNTLTTRFTAIDEHRTRYEIDGEYTAFRGFMPNLISRVMPGMFTKPSQRWLDNFKAFAEQQ